MPPPTNTSTSHTDTAKQKPSGSGSASDIIEIESDNSMTAVVNGIRQSQNNNEGTKKDARTRGGMPSDDVADWVYSNGFKIARMDSNSKPQSLPVPGRDGERPKQDGDSNNNIDSVDDSNPNPNPNENANFFCDCEIVAA